MNAFARHSPAENPIAQARTASLVMYDLEGLQAANDALWTAIARRFEDYAVAGVPHRLTRGVALDDVWADPQLLLAQTCGYPLAGLIKTHQVQLVATPRYRAPGCDGPFHRSVIVVRAGSAATNLADLRGSRCVINDPGSNTGMNLLRLEVAPFAQEGVFFGSVQVSGAHEASAERIADGQADIAAIDCITWAHLKRFRPELTQNLKVLMWTVRSPGLPLITGRNTNQATLRALRVALDDIERDPALREVRAQLMLEGFNTLPAAQYHAVSYLEQIAADQGYPVLA